MPDQAYGLVVFVVSTLGGLLGGYLGAYVKKKGENTATKEDLASITRIAEDIKAEFAKDAAAAAHDRSMLLEAFRASQNLRTLAGSERLAAHQMAFSMWQKLATTDPRDDKYWRECTVWWNQNCLYLDTVARQAFIQAVASFEERRGLLIVGQRSQEIANTIVTLGDRLRAAGNSIMEGAGLPALNGDEMAVTQRMTEQSAGN